MAYVGILGNIVFSASAKQVRTFTAMQWNSSARYATHNRHLKSPIVERVGRDTDSVTFSMTLSALLGVNPRNDLDRLHEMNINGELVTLMIGVHVYGTVNGWVVQRLQREFERYGKNGVLLCAKVSVTLLEYPKR
jgi:phage protein U